jgi:hypothetical protein
MRRDSTSVSGVEAGLTMDSTVHDSRREEGVCYAFGQSKVAGTITIP